MSKTVAITSAAGEIERSLRRGLHGKYGLRLLDVAVQEPADFDPTTAPTNRAQATSAGETQAPRLNRR